MIEAGHRHLSVRRQCELMGLSRSGLYYRPVGESAENLQIMRLIDEVYTQRPFYGVEKMTGHLQREGWQVNPKRVRRLMRKMGLEAIYPKKRLSVANEGHKRYPYLLKGMLIERPDQVWCADITYLRLRRGFLYLAAVMDWYSRYVLAWEVSESLDADFCLQALGEALRRGRPEIFNTDQGVQFTCEAFTGALEGQCVRISMDGRGRCYDNIFVERLWRTVKYEEVFLSDYADSAQARLALKAYFRFYNEQRPHQALDYRTPAEVYSAGTSAESREGSAAARTVAGTPVALRAPSVPATVGSWD
jgi:putative transposase